jgi:anti-sigma B factor antagonist
VLRIERSLDAGCDVVETSGELDLTNVDQLEDGLLGTSSEAVILDLSGLQYIDSAGMRALDQAHRRLAAEGRALVIVAPEDSRAGWAFRVAGFVTGVVLDSVDLAHERIREGI